MKEESPTIMLPIRGISKANLDMTVQELILETDLEGDEQLFIDSAGFPEELQNTGIGRMIYLGGDVHVLSTKEYLRSINLDTTLSALFQEKGLYFPINPNYFKKVE